MKHQVRRTGAALGSGACSIRSRDKELHKAVDVKLYVGRLGDALGSGSVALGPEISSCIRQWACSIRSGD